MIFIFFSSVFFLGRTNLKLIEKQKSSKGSEGMLLWKIFENLDAANGFFSAF